MSTEIRPRHFASALIEDLRFYKRARQQHDAAPMPVFDWIERLLHHAIHFVMPANGLLFYDGLRGLEPGLRLPFPVVALEYSTDRPGGSCFGGAVECPDRVSLAVDLKQTDLRPEDDEVNKQWNSIPGFDDGIVVLGCARYGGRFLPLTGAVWFNPDFVEDVNRNAPGQDAAIDKMAKYYAGGDLKIGVKGFGRQSMLITSAETAAALVAKYGHEHAYGMMWADSLDEKTAVFEFMEAMSCSNVSAQPLSAAPKHLNAKRAKKGRPPLFEYKIIGLDLPTTTNRNEGNVPSGARHSPRVHLRRGHIRRLENRKIWVNAAVVGSKDRGVIQSDYRVAVSTIASGVIKT